MKKEFKVNYEILIQGNIDVCAENKDEANDIVKELLNERPDEVDLYTRTNDIKERKITSIEELKEDENSLSS